MERTCLATAVDLLSRREHSQLELQRKLAAKGYDSDEIDEVLFRLIEDRLQSDERYAESYVRQRLEKGCGPLRIRQELKQKGVPDHLVDHSLSEHEDKWVGMAQRVYEKKYAEPPSDFKERGKRVNFLRYRGFSMDQINIILNQE